ncbi:c-type cytochrome [Fibrobacterota bacterium]
MNLLVVFAVIAALAALKFTRLSLLSRLLLWLLAAFVMFRFGFSPALPGSVISLFMLVVTACLGVYGTAIESEELKAVSKTAAGFLSWNKHPFMMTILLIALPVLIGLRVYVSQSARGRAPVFDRTIHPASPDSIIFRGKTVHLKKGDNPFRKLEKDKPEEFKEHIANGVRVYYENCVFCHGPDLRGQGNFSHGFYPRPASLADPSVLKGLSEPYLFWRISKGPQIPEEAAPWASAMPAWETFLSEEEIWDAIIYLYDFTGFRPEGSK